LLDFLRVFLLAENCGDGHNLLLVFATGKVFSALRMNFLHFMAKNFLTKAQRRKVYLNKLPWRALRLCESAAGGSVAVHPA
jgi:hypothetical protein